ncbi:molecular chaperone [Thermodesulfobacteriota bacterium]
MDIKDWVIQETLKMEVYKILANCYYQPGPDLIGKLDHYNRDVDFAFRQVANYMLKMKDEIRQLKDLDCLKIDFTRLFIGPYALLAPPYGSVYLENDFRVMGDSTLHALEMYRETGVNVADGFNDAPDHIAAELEFIYFLIFKEIEAINNSDLDGVIMYVEKRKTFLLTHLGSWIADFARNVEENAETEFYKNLARATKVFIMRDLEELLEITRSFEESGYLSISREEGSINEIFR